MATEALEKAIAVAKELPATIQDDLAQVVFDYLGRDAVDLTPEDVTAIRASRLETARGEYASDDEMRAIWARYGA